MGMDSVSKKEALFMDPEARHMAPWCDTQYDVADGAQVACSVKHLKELIAGWQDPFNWQGQY